MSEDFPEPSPAILGDYRLLNLVAEDPNQRRWLAEQVSVGRHVLIDELRPEALAGRNSFLADVRAKGAVDHPLIGSVYEAVDGGEHCYFAHELLAGVDLAQRAQANEPFEPGKLAHILKKVAEAQLYFEAQSIAAIPMSLAAIHVDSHAVTRIDNLALAGLREPDRSAGDICDMGMMLPQLVADGKPGATRIGTLLAWMRGEGIPQPLTWQQVRDYCMQIEQQLVEPTRQMPAAGTNKGESPRKNQRFGWAIGSGIAALIAVLVALSLMRGRKKNTPVEDVLILPEAIPMAAGQYPTAEGGMVSLEAYRLASHEVTIRQFAEFLETLDRLGADGRASIFDAEDQPAEKSDHMPDDWQALLSAAKSNGEWRGRTVTLDHPVAGVDWWDAAAYAEWKKARLPRHEEWFAAFRKEVEIPAAIPSSDWLAVTRKTQDRTPNGLIGMAGSLCEWMRDPAVNPANPLAAKRWVLSGGSYLKQGSNALTREWLDDRSLRRPDIGFRIAFELD